MTLLIVGLVLFLGAHSVRIVAEGWRTRTIARIGAGPWKGAYSLVSLAGFVALVVGYAQARLASPVLWTVPAWTHHAAALLVLVAFVLLAASNVPGNAIKSRIHHPMVVGVKVWAFAHLLVNGTVAGVLLFGGFLVWAIADFASARRRDRATGTTYPPGRARPTVMAILGGAVVWAVFAFWAHRLLFGVDPLG